LVSIAVVSNIPASGFEDTKSELRELHLVHETGGHTFVSILSSFEVGTSSTRRTSIFHVSTLKARATEVASDHRGKRFSIDNNSSCAIKNSRFNMTSEGSTVAIEPVMVQAVTETKSMDNFMHDTDHVSFMQENITSRFQIFSTDGGMTDKRSIGSAGEQVVEEAT